MMPRPSLAVAATLAAVLSTAVAMAAAAPKADPRSRTEALVVALKAFVVPPEGGSLSAAERAVNERAGQALDGFFAYDRLTKGALGPSASAFNPAQRARFDRDFRALVRQVSFMRSASFVRQAKVEVQAPEAHGAQVWVRVHAAVPAEDVETDLAFVYEDTGPSWQIVDVDFDGVSFAKDYQNQFGKLIKKNGVEGLLQKLADRLQREQAS